MSHEQYLPGQPPPIAAEAAELASVAMVVVDGSAVRWHNAAAARLVEPHGSSWADPTGPVAVVASVDGGPACVRWAAPDATVRWWRVESQELPGGRLIELIDETDHDGGPASAIPGIATWEWDVVSDRVRASAGLLEMLGLPQGTELDRRRVAELVQSEDGRMLLRAVRGGLRTGEPWERTVGILSTDRSGTRAVDVRGARRRDVATGPPLRVVGTARDVTELQSARRELAFLAGHDAQTGVACRGSVLARLAECAADRDRAALVLVDVDRLGEVNELHGIAVGDEVLGELAGLLRRAVGRDTLIGRIGGDRFAVVLPGRSSAAAFEVGARLCDVVHRTPIPAGADTVHVGVSAGIAEVVPGDVSATLANAAVALAEAKRAGRNRAVRFTQDMHRAAISKASLLRRVTRALDDGSLGLDVQPIVDLRTGRVTRHELLLRLRDGQEPPLGPAEFLPAVEQTELVLRIDRWVIEQAVRALATPGARAADLRLEANVSGRSLEDPEFGAWILAQLRRHGVEAGRLGVEVTETAAVTELPAARDLATLLIDAGMGFALDDFGAGFGSFSYLKHLRFTSVKIAGDFVAQVDHSDTDRALVGAVVAVARQLGLVTVAEQVDRPGLVEELRRLGVDHGQGFHLGRPVPLSAVVGARPAS
ncbi:MAG: bifunctional diguanylate cyclase/phosphodiesterase [Pseudonocardia sp.]|nr:bifunctional diguanylate cyclase/phosphodiesterase [Pseudonocardia sp.]